MANKVEIVNGIKWEFVTDGAAAMIKRVSANVSGDLVIPSFLGGVAVKCTGGSLFRKCTKLQSITIPETLTALSVDSINDPFQYNPAAMFEDCVALQEFKVAKRNRAYKSVNGLLLSKGGETLLAAPRGLAFEHVKIPAGVITIGEGAFKGCRTLKRVTILAGVQTIEAEAFKGCCSLEKVVIPDGVVCIKEAAFKDCDNLVSVKIPSSVTEISYPILEGNQGAFANCGSLREVLVEDCNPVYKSIDGLLLEDNAKSKDYRISIRGGYTLRAVPGGKIDVTIPDCVTSISAESFEGCAKLKNLTIPSSIMNISGYVFNDCVGLENVTIPNKLKDDVGSSKLFHGAKIPDNLFPKGVKINRIFAAGEKDVISEKRKIEPDEKAKIAMRKKMGNKVFKEDVNGVKWEYKFTDHYRSAMLISAPKSISGDIVVPEILGGAKVTAICGGAFTGCGKLTNLTIPDSVVKCGATFAGCKKLESVTISAGMQDYTALFFIRKSASDLSFDASVFKTCGSIRTIKVSEQNPMYKSANGLLLSKDGKMLLAAPAGIKSVIIPDGVQEIGETAFKYCNSLESVTLSESVKTIGMEAFHNCKKLLKVIIPSGVQEIYDDAFFGCSSLECLTIPGSVKEIGCRAFSECQKLQSLIISDGVREIGECAFSGCRELKEVTIPASVKMIDSCAFSGCEKLEHVTFSDGVSCTVESSAFDCDSLESVTLPAGVKARRDAFSEDAKINRVK